MTRMPVTYRAPLAAWPELGTEMDRFLEGIIGRPALWRERRADLYETEDAYVLELEVPGFEADDIDLQFENGMLVVTGARSVEDERQNGGKTYHVRERSFERFSRSFTLPESVDPDEVKANLEHGVLTVTLPKAPGAKPRRIRIGSKKK